MQATVLLCDDDRTLRTVLDQAFSQAGYKVHATPSLMTLWRWVQEGRGDIIISDVMLPDGNGLDLIPMVRKKRPKLPILVISAQNAIMSAMRANEVGANDFLSKPFDLHELLIKTKNALKIEDSQPAQEPALHDLFDMPIIGKSKTMQALYRLVASSLNQRHNIVISGNLGSGKTLIASIYLAYAKKENKIIQSFYADEINKSHVTNPFLLTDKTRRPCDLMIIEDVDELAPSIQADFIQYLKVLDDKGNPPKIIATTKSDLSMQVRQNKFKQALCDFLNVIPIHMPDLNQRLDDIPELAYYFARHAPKKPSFTQKALLKLQSYDWPGNVREFKHFIEKLTVFCQDKRISDKDITKLSPNIKAKTPLEPTIYADHLDDALIANIRNYLDNKRQSGQSDRLYQNFIEKLDAVIIAHTLSYFQGNQIKSADYLGINRNTLRKKMKTFKKESKGDKKAP